MRHAGSDDHETQRLVDLQPGKGRRHSLWCNTFCEARPVDTHLGEAAGQVAVQKQDAENWNEDERRELTQEASIVWHFVQHTPTHCVVKNWLLQNAVADSRGTRRGMRLPGIALT